MQRGENIHARPSEKDFDTLAVIDHIKDFSDFLAAATQRYEFNASRITEIDTETQDILHYIELADTRKKITIYNRLSEIRRERRCCKNENDVLKPVYDWIKTSDQAVNRLPAVLGACRKTKDIVTNREYGLRTDILDGLVD